ncbi:hypothetical protein AGMMS4957_18460 [Bacteroidia bacterium]|nr:hypothetical protein AGMMS4957_18460 [Bacteroidia bacterium]
MEQLKRVQQAQQVETGQWCDTEMPQFSEEFQQLIADAITGEELKEYMHQVIDSWPWKDR